jgi:hypothetical protein
LPDSRFLLPRVLFLGSILRINSDFLVESVFQQATSFADSDSLNSDRLQFFFLPVSDRLNTTESYPRSGCLAVSRKFDGSPYLESGLLAKSRVLAQKPLASKSVKLQNSWNLSAVRITVSAFVQPSSTVDYPQTLSADVGASPS